MISTFNLIKLKSLLEDFYRLTKIRITVFDENFNELTAYPEQISPVCQLIRTDSQAAAACKRCDEQACMAAARQHKPFTYRCHAGLTESIAPLFMGSLPIGYLLFGHVFSYDTHGAGWQQIKKLCAPYQIDRERLKAACYEQPLIAADFITSATHILQAVAYYLCLERMVSLHQQELPVRIDGYISNHFTEPVSVTGLCERFNIGKTRLYEIVRQNYGTGLAEHVRSLRIGKAKELLTGRPDLTLAEVAAQCGFEDYNYFITVFKRIVGVPPKTYAKSMRKP